MIPKLKIDNGDAWKDRLVVETLDLCRKIDDLEKTFASKDFKLNYQEWTMLTDQLKTMQNYRYELMRRCHYYHLVQDEPVNESCCLKCGD